MDKSSQSYILLNSKNMTHAYAYVLILKNKQITT